MAADAHMRPDCHYTGEYDPDMHGGAQEASPPTVRPGTLPEFLDARFAERQAAVEAAVRSRADAALPEIARGPLLYIEAAGGNEPPAVREVILDLTAKRSLVALYAEHADQDCPDEPYEYAIGRTVGLGEALRLLALQFADHPQYRREWAPR